MHQDIIQVLENDGDGESQITFNLENLNYVKKKLFDPEIQYINQKLKSILKEETEHMLQKTIEALKQSENTTRNEIQMLKTMCEHIE